MIGELGLNVRDANGNIKPDIFAQFGEATKDLSPALRDMIAETIAGQDAIRAFAIGAGEGRRGLKLAQLQMEATGTAAAIAAARSKGLSGSFSALASNSETLGTSLGKLASGPVKGLVGELNATLVALNQLASGDFSGFADGIEKDFQQAEANIRKHAGGLQKIFFGKGFGDTFSGLKDLFAPADNVDKDVARINNLNKALQQLQGLRVQAFTIGADIRPITAKIQDIRRQLKEAQAGRGPADPRDAAREGPREAPDGAEDRPGHPLRGACHGRHRQRLLRQGPRRSPPQHRRPHQAHHQELQGEREEDGQGPGGRHGSRSREVLPEAVRPDRGSACARHAGGDQRPPRHDPEDQGRCTPHGSRRARRSVRA